MEKEKKNASGEIRKRRLFVTFLTLGLIWTLSYILGKYTWVGLIFGGVLTLLFIYYGIRVVPADPAQKAIVMFFGKRLKKVLYEGWNFLPLSPVVFDTINIKVVKVNQDLPVQVVRTPDFAELGVTISVTWTPGREKVTEKDEAEAFIMFLNSGEEDGVKKIIEDVIRDRLRAWAFSREEGPADWQEAIGAKDDVIAVLLKAILGDDLSLIPSDIPTSVLLKYFSVPRRRPLKFEAEKWGNDWKKLEEHLKNLAPEDYTNLKVAVEKRRSVIQEVRQGNGFFYKKALGITINRFTINEIVLQGKTAEAVDSIAQEKYEREADEIELKNVLERIKELKKELGFSSEQALEVVQTERNKVVKSIQESKFNISPETRQMIEKIFPELFSIFRKRT